MKKILATLALASAFSLSGAPVSAADLRLYAAAGVKSPLIELADQFEKANSQKITLIFDTAGAAEKSFLGDADATFLITTRTLISNDIKAKHLPDGVLSDVGETVAGFAAPPGAPHPDISSSAAFKAALLAAPRIVFSDPARGATVGTHFMKVIESLGIKDEVLKKSILAKDGVETMHLILSGGADLGITQISEIVQADHSTLVGPFPKEFDLASTYSLWYRKDAPDIAKKFAQFLTSAEAREKLEEHGLRSPVAQ